MKKSSTFLAFCLCLGLPVFLSAQLNFTFLSNLDYDVEVSDIWGYVAPDGTEYALVGMFDGVSIVNLADPENPVESDFIDGVPSGWRDIKTWGEYAYVINETGNGLAVLDLSNLPNSVSAYDWAPSLPGLGTLGSCHNIFIDEFGVAYLVGCSLNAGGLLMVDVATDPGNPIFISAGAPVYSHDVYVRDNIAYSSEIYTGSLAFYDVSDKNNVQLLATQQTPALFTHNAWPSDNSQYIFTTDEIGGAPVASYDISDLNDIKELDQFRPYTTLGSGVIPHNVHVWNDFIIVSYYTDGCLIIDAARPDNLIEVGYFDTYIPTNTGFQGAWGAYPFLPSGIVLVSDIGDGLYVLEPTYVRACYLEGTITDASNGLPIPNATADILNTVIFENSNNQGVYKTGVAISDTYQVEYSAPGYKPEIVEVALENGELEIVDVALEPLPSFGFSGQVIDKETGNPVPNAIVEMVNDAFNYLLETDAQGAFSVASFFEGDYEITAGKWGYKTLIIDSENLNPANNSIALEIEEGIEDIFSLDLGWQVITSAFGEVQWEIGDPIEVLAPAPISIPITPEDDVDDPGNECYVTGIVGSLENGILLGGLTTMESPVFDLSGYSKPMMSLHTWFFNIDQTTFGLGNDFMRIIISNGSTIESVKDIQYFELTQPEWEYHEIDIAAAIEPTDNMQVSIVANAGSDFNGIIEAGVDYFRIWDADSTVNTQDLPNEKLLSFDVFPNPSEGPFTVSYDLVKPNIEASILIQDLMGRTLEKINVTDQNGRITINHSLEPGLYYLRLEDELGNHSMQKVIIQ